VIKCPPKEVQINNCNQSTKFGKVPYFRFLNVKCFARHFIIEAWIYYGNIRTDLSTGRNYNSGRKSAGVST
jgi:hypothetical protein